jgi:hypothetical protein
MDLKDLTEIARRRRALSTAALIWLPIFCAISISSHHHRARVQPYRPCTTQPSQAVPATQAAQSSRSKASTPKSPALRPSAKSR